MNSPEDKKPSQLLSSPIAKKHVNLDDSLVTPCPTKYAKLIMMIPSLMTENHQACQVLRQKQTIASIR